MANRRAKTDGGVSRRAQMRRISQIFGRATVVGEKMRSGVAVSTIVKYALYTVLSVLLILLETTFFARFRPFGASPDILIVTVMAIGMYDGGRAGAVYGIWIGFVADTLGGAGITVLPLAYMLVGYICGVVAEDYYRRTVLLFLIFDAAVCAARMFITLLYVFLTWPSFDFGAVFGAAILPELAATAVCAPTPAIILLPVYLIFRKKRAETEQD